MLRDKYLDMSKIIRDKKIFELFRIVENHGGVLRFVGGAVRDALSGIEGFDLDLATDLSPDELVEICEENNIKTVPIGIKFGTVGVIINDKILEITSLRKDTKTDGRHAEVEFTGDWEIDASRRDLTINAVYADEKGNVFDYYNGIEDLENGKIRFIGSPSVRIKEDYLRILRFFRFYSLFGKGEIDQKSLQACISNKDGLKQLSLERIRDELFKILKTPRAAEVLQIMKDNEILSSILPEPKNLDKLKFLIRLIEKYKIEPNVLRRLFLIYEPDQMLAENLANRLKLSKKEKQLFLNWAEFTPPLQDYFDGASRNKLIYHYGKEFCQNKLLLQLALEKRDIPDVSALLEKIEKFEIPVFPLRGRDIINAGIGESSEIGTILKNLEKIWIDSNFSLTSEQLLQKIAK